MRSLLLPHVCERHSFVAILFLHLTRMYACVRDEEKTKVFNHFNLARHQQVLVERIRHSLARIDRLTCAQRMRSTSRRRRRKPPINDRRPRAVSNKVTHSDAQRSARLVHLLVCQNFLLHADSGLAHRLQQEECRRASLAVHRRRRLL